MAIFILPNINEEGDIARTRGQQILPYEVGDSSYPILTQIHKPFTARTTWSADQNAYDENMKKW